MSHASMISVAVLGALEQALNTALALDPATLDKLSRLQGRVVAIDMRGTGMIFYLLPTNHGLRLMGSYDGEPDTTLRGGPMALARMSSGPAGEGLFSGDVEIIGNVELGQRIQRIFQQLDIDWEEHLSRLTGDIIAHQVGNAVRGLFAFGQRASSKLGRDSTEYLQEETDVLPTSHEVEEFLASVDKARTATDRLEARVKRLQKAFEQIDMDKQE